MFTSAPPQQLAPAPSAPVESAPFPSAPVQSDNPFLPPAPQFAAAEPASNPFLDAPVTFGSPEAGSRPAAERAQPGASSSPRVIPPQMGAPLAVQPGVVAPTVKDPHAEFRRGSMRGVLVFAGVAAAVLVGLFFLVPQPVEQPEASDAPVQRSKATIGGSLPPDRIVDDEEESAEDNQQAFKKTEAEARERQNGSEAPAARPEGIPSEGNFADAFKSAAR